MAAVLAVSACTKKKSDWGDLEQHVRPQCQQFYRVMTVDSGGSSSKKEWDPRSLGETAYTNECAKIAAPSIQPCATEFEVGTDSAMQCVARRSQPALAYAVWEICARHAKPDEGRDECEGNAAAASGDIARMKAWGDRNRADALGGTENIAGEKK